MTDTSERVAETSDLSGRSTTYIDCGPSTRIVEDGYSDVRTVSLEDHAQALHDLWGRGRTLQLWEWVAEAADSDDDGHPVICGAWIDNTAPEHRNEHEIGQWWRVARGEAQGQTGR